MSQHEKKDTRFDKNIQGAADLRVKQLFFEASLHSEAIDMKEPINMQRAREFADSLIAYGSMEYVTNLEDVLFTTKETKKTSGPLAHLAVKLAKSKLLLADIIPRTHVTYVIPMYGETNRIKPRGPSSEAGQHPFGEDFVRQKYIQLGWLHSDQPHITYDARFVDDGCEVGSGALASEIITTEGYANFSVQYLADGLRNKNQNPQLVQIALGSLESTSESRKAGALFYGAADAIATIEQQDVRHVVVFTDADLSVDVGQSGLVIEPIVSGKASLAAGSRRERLSYSDKPESRDKRGKALIYLKELAVPGIFPTDTQCPLKAFDASLLKNILTEGIDAYTMTYDFDVFAKVAKKGTNVVQAVPLAHFDSVEESTTDTATYLDINNVVIKLSQQLEYKRDPETSSFWLARRARNLLREISQRQNTYLRFLDLLPRSITDTEPYETDFFNPDKLNELESIVYGESYATKTPSL